MEKYADKIKSDKTFILRPPGRGSRFPERDIITMWIECVTRGIKNNVKLAFLDYNIVVKKIDSSVIVEFEEVNPKIYGIEPKGIIKL